MVASRSVAALNEPPTPSIASLSERVEGYAAVPLKVRCSRKWAMPAWSRDSRRDPARTKTAADTDRAPARRVEITRGPSASAVRWNIAGMVPEQPRHPECEAAGADGAGRVRCVELGSTYLGR